MAADDGHKMTPQSAISGLLGAARNWPDPEAKEPNGWVSPTATNAKGSAYQKDSGGPDPEKHLDTLVGQAQDWPTPRAMSGGPETAERKTELGRLESGGGDLQSSAQAWPTPASRDWKGSTDQSRMEGSGIFAERLDQLDRRAERWPSPRAEDSEAIGNHGDARDSLYTEARNWGTPRVTNNLGIPTENTGRGSRLEDQAACPSSLPDLLTWTPGDGSWRSARSLLPLFRLILLSHRLPGVRKSWLRLNPQFVEYLMGWPIYWTSAPIGSGPAATAWSHWLQASRFSLWQIAPDGWRNYWTKAAPPPKTEGPDED